MAIKFTQVTSAPDFIYSTFNFYVSLSFEELRSSEHLICLNIQIPPETPAAIKSPQALSYEKFGNTTKSLRSSQRFKYLVQIS